MPVGATELEVLGADCCAPLLDSPLQESEAAALARAFKVLADPGRLRLLSAIAARPKKEACVCELLPFLDLSQPTISHHLKVLHEAGLLWRQRRSSWVYYGVRPEALEPLRAVLAPPGVPVV
jgi:ArsR family transcriptional regulator, arsenate/arsenite/antimonite-responsive transcriptional repressor